jgi:hypothetical protein
MAESKVKIKVDADTSEALRKAKELQSAFDKTKNNGRKYAVTLWSIVSAVSMFVFSCILLLIKPDIGTMVLEGLCKFYSFLWKLGGVYILGNAAVKYTNIFKK